LGTSSIKQPTGKLVSKTGGMLHIRTAMGKRGKKGKVLGKQWVNATVLLKEKHKKTLAAPFVGDWLYNYHF